ncbi:MAG: hypothetical protein GXO79_03290 [Chlorobi bacterium]|nr:hypothetical protein [Chlorobiota bacterium]
MLTKKELKSKKYFNILLLLLLLIFSQIIVAQNQNEKIIELTIKQDYYKIGKSVYYYEDKSNKLNLKDIQNSDFQNNFKLSKQKILNFGFSNSTYWLKFHVVKKQINNNDYVIQIEYPPLDDIKFYYFNKQDSQWKMLEYGDLFPFSSREIKHREYIMPLNGENSVILTYYLKIKSSGTIQLPIYIRTLKSMLYSSTRKELFVGFFIGLLLIMALYNLFIYFSLRDLNYLYYS